MAKARAVLAYSGGLDTSVMVRWLIEEKGFEVIAMAGDVGQTRQDLEYIRQKAVDIGAHECLVIDMREEFVSDFLTKALAANALYENKYPLVSALSRPILAKHLVEVAAEYNAQYVVHGCTGKGNDQVRFEVSATTLDPDLQVLAPLREWDLLTREQEMQWAAARGIPVPTTVSQPYSIDDNIWGRTIECGILEDPWVEPPEDIYELTQAPDKGPDDPQYIVVGFDAGVPCSLDGLPMSFYDIIVQLNEIGGRHGYGRIDMIENRLVGLKSREIYETPGALALIEAHKALEDMTLERDLLHYKLSVEHVWATQVYYGHWYSPLKQALDAFIASTQPAVTGEVRLKFHKGTCLTVGRRSDYSLYDYSLATYGEQDSFDRTAAKGFIDIFGLAVKTWARQQRKLGL
ncbi:MAG: argininosuccinate synthase [Coriobacteriales bacterium]|jgi:argininosuccinate synthase|nr:argininosuccinate synthase [Coriobacteriales bacterium]